MTLRWASRFIQQIEHTLKQAAENAFADAVQGRTPGGSRTYAGGILLAPAGLFGPVKKRYLKPMPV
jgi:hypothetical protein